MIFRQDEDLVEEEKVAQKSDEALSSLLAEKRELLDAQACQLDELNRLHLNLNTRKSKLSIKVSGAEEKKEQLNKELVKKQQTVLHLNVEHNSCVESLHQMVESVQHKISGRGQNEDFIPTTFLGTMDKQSILLEDRELCNKIDEYIDLNLKQTHKTSDGSDQSIWKERTEKEQEKLVAEVTRLKICHQQAEQKCILKSAELASAKSAKDELDMQSKRLIQGQISLQKYSLEGTISELESSINKLQEELTNLVKDKLPLHLEESTSTYCQSVFKADLEAKIKRQNKTLSNMDTAIDFLSKQASYQESLGLLIENEGNGILELKEQISRIFELQKEEGELDDKGNKSAILVNELKNRRSKKILQAEDTFLLALHKILTNTSVEPNMITEDDVMKLVSNFVENINGLDKLVLQTEAEWHRKKSYMEGLIERIQKELEIDSNNRCVLVPTDVANKIKLAENKVREFEIASKKKIEEWELLKRDIKSHPFLATQKKFYGTNILENFGSTLQ